MLSIVTELNLYVHLQIRNRTPLSHHVSPPGNPVLPAGSLACLELIQRPRGKCVFPARRKLMRVLRVAGRFIS